MDQSSDGLLLVYLVGLDGEGSDSKCGDRSKEKAQACFKPAFLNLKISD
jgi:hypothetical protein